MLNLGQSIIKKIESYYDIEHQVAFVQKAMHTMKVKRLIGYFLFLVFFLSFFASGVVDSQDGFQYLAVARNIYYKGRPSALESLQDENKKILWTTYLGKDNNVYSATGLGYSLAMLPSVFVTDIVYKIYNMPPPTSFPLKSDWLILLLTSFTNIGFAAFLGVISYLFLHEIGLKDKQSLLISFLTIISTNLFTLSKHIYPHMMFTALLFFSFYCIRVYSSNHQKRYLLLSSLSFGIHIITYNQTFIFSVLPLFVYYLLLNKNSLKGKIYDGLFFLLGIIPFLACYGIFESVRARATSLYPFAIGEVIYHITNRLGSIPVSLYIQGLYGQLLSPGRSIFVYSPLLLLLLLAWHKITKKIVPELIVFLLLAIQYILFFPTIWRADTVLVGVEGLWHGESSWGPRYLATLIPFGMLVVGYIFSRLTNKQKLYIFYPLMFLGIYVELLGIIFPYQTKFSGLDPYFIVNNIQYNTSEYINFLPEFNPIYTTTKKLLRLPKSFYASVDNGPYNVQFTDGVDFPFSVGLERLRVIEGEGYISFDNNSGSGINNVSFELINRPTGNKKPGATISFVLNEKQLLNKPVILKSDERKVINLLIDNSLLKPGKNEIVISINNDGKLSFEKSQQIIGIVAMYVNGARINLDTINVPFVSTLGPKTTNAVYRNWGGTNQDEWKPWNIHTQVYERTPDFWWLKGIYYWDIPKTPFILALVANICLISYFSMKVYKNTKL